MPHRAPGYRKLPLLLFLFLAIPLFTHADPPSPPDTPAQDRDKQANTLLDGSIGELERVVADLQENSKRIQELTLKIASLESDSKSSATELAEQKALLASYQSKVRELETRYTKLIELAAHMKKELETARIVGYIAVPAAVFATTIAVLEAILLVKR